MIPKSTAKLKEGDYCLVMRDDGGYVPFVYVGKRNNERSYFFGALADIVVSDTNSKLPERIELLEHALLHIKCYKENNTPIVGNLLDHLDQKALAHIQSDISTSGIGHTVRVWGYRTIIKYANNI